MGILNPYGAPVQPSFQPYIDGPLVEVTPPLGSPLSLTEAKLACQIDADITADDSRVTGLIEEATDWLIRATGGLQLFTATFQLPIRVWWGGWVGGYPGLSGILGTSYGLNIGDGTLRLPHPPLWNTGSVIITYYDSNDTLQTLASSTYIVRTAMKQPGEIDLAPNQVWPSLSPLRKYPITVQFTAGILTPVTCSGSTLTAVVQTLTAGQSFQISCSTDGALPAPLVAGVKYYVVNPTNGGLSFQLSATSGGSAITLTTAGSGSLWAGKLPPLARNLLLRRVAFGYRERMPGADDEFERESSDHAAAMLEWGGYK